MQPNANALPCRVEKARLQRELRLEAHITRVLDATAWDGLPSRDVPGTPESEAA